jgi:thymidine kinase
MFSGKTTRLIQLINQRNPEECLVLKPIIDNRYAIDSIVSHNKVSVAAKAVKDLNYNYLKSKNYINRYIFIDEGHMFGEQLIPFITQARSDGYHVYVSAVEKVFDGNDFECIKEAIEIADWAYHKQGKCSKCSGKSFYSHLKKIPSTKNSGNEIIVGGTDLYEPLCVDCFNKNK